ncbi:Poly(A) polymerase [Thozetella sp. PMI_491]|nr:Poly(A) polymerase [Thozetella sp. PMI_491]
MSEKVYGLTPPISTALPTDDQVRANEALRQELKDQGTFESSQETAKREEVLKSLQKITNAFVQKVAKIKEPNQTVLIRDARGRIFTYGSYRLGVYGPGSDIDTLVVVPSYVSRDDYFAYFPDLLVEMAPAGAITDLKPVPDAFVPIIKFEYSGISIDLIFGSIKSLKQLPAGTEWSLASNTLLRGLTVEEVRSLNGTRVTDDIINLVPEVATFRLALRAIKLWAQRKAIYGNIVGYPGGVAWAMLVARVCQLYPKATSAVVVQKFFFIMQKWPWPQPVLLKNIEDGPLPIPVWNPKVNKKDAFHLMPIITPAYPSMCATHNVTHSTMGVIQRELMAAVQLTDKIMNGRGATWKDLFQKHSFFTKSFRYYITVTAISRTKAADKVWAGFVESRVRLLVGKLEQHPSIGVARPFPKGFERLHRCKEDNEVRLVTDGSLKFQVKPDEVAEILKKLEAKGKAESDGDGEASAAKTEEGVANGNGAVKSELQELMDDKVKTETNGHENGLSSVKPEEEDGSESKLADIPAHTDDNENIVFTSSHYIGLELAEGAKSLDLSREVNDFKHLLMNYENQERVRIYDPALMNIAIQHIRAVDLPDDVFEPGDVRPAKTLKKKRPAPPAAKDGPPKRQQTAAAAS